jgi:segregation and condensation protein A
VAFDQVTPLGELTVRWTGEDVMAEREVDDLIRDEFDGAPAEADDGPAQETPEGDDHE